MPLTPANNAYDIAKTLNVYWAGVRYTVIPHLDLTAAYYGYRQNAYATGSEAGCTTAWPVDTRTTRPTSIRRSACVTNSNRYR
jgi:hypothetical protein